MRLISDVSEYRADDILPDDRVLDIGANIGAFASIAYHHTRFVAAIEPVTFDDLLDNLRHTTISLKRAALGTGDYRRIAWDEKGVFIRTQSLKELIKLAGGCTFLKCDAEGAEWTITPEHLKGVRRIEMELHTPPISDYRPNPFLWGYLHKHYRCELTPNDNRGLGVMGVLHAYEI